jgi:hypothetical protein
MSFDVRNLLLATSDHRECPSEARTDSNRPPPGSKPSSLKKATKAVLKALAA